MDLQKISQRLGQTVAGLLLGLAFLLLEFILWKIAYQLVGSPIIANLFHALHSLFLFFLITLVASSAWRSFKRRKISVKDRFLTNFVFLCIILFVTGYFWIWK